MLQTYSTEKAARSVTTLVRYVFGNDVIELACEVNCSGGQFHVCLGEPDAAIIPDAQLNSAITSDHTAAHSGWQVIESFRDAAAALDRAATLVRASRRKLAWLKARRAERDRAAA